MGFWFKGDFWVECRRKISAVVWVMERAGGVVWVVAGVGRGW